MACLHPSATPVTLTASVVSHTDRSVLTTPSSSPSDTPALLYRMSRPPKVSTANDTDAATESSSVTSVEHVGGIAAGTADRVDRVGTVADIGDDNRRSLGGEQLGGDPTEPAGGSGDQGGPAGQSALVGGLRAGHPAHRTLARAVSEPEPDVGPRTEGWSVYRRLTSRGDQSCPNPEPFRSTFRASWDLLIGGERVAARDGERFAVSNPATGEELAQVARAGPDDLDGRSPAPPRRPPPGRGRGPRRPTVASSCAVRPISSGNDPRSSHGSRWRTPATPSPTPAGRRRPRPRVRLLRRRRQQAPRLGRPDPGRRHRHGAQGAGRGVRPDRSVELPDADRVLEARSRPGVWQLGRAQAGVAHSAHGPRPGRDPGRRRRARCVDHRPARSRGNGGRRAGRGPPCRQDLVHR